MIKGITRSGYAFAVPKDALDDMELMEAIVAVHKNNPMELPNVITLLLGAGQKKAFYDHLRNKDGRVRMTAVMAAVEDVFGAFSNQEKNS